MGLFSAVAGARGLAAEADAEVPRGADDVSIERHSAPLADGFRDESCGRYRASDARPCSRISLR